MKQWHFFDKVYRVWVVLLVGEPEEFYKFMEDTTYKEVEELRQGSTTGWQIELNSENTENANYCQIIWVRKFEVACLIHELAHLVMSIFDDKGIPIRRENTEAFSYYQEFWFNEVQRARRKFPNGCKPKDVKK